MKDRPDRYEQELIAEIVDADNVVTKYPSLADGYTNRRDTMDEALCLYRAIQYGELTDIGTALAEYRAKEAEHANSKL